MRTGGRRGWRPLRTFSAGFNPLVLFGAGEQGGWWDPSDFSTMFQDSAGTTPVTAAGQPVGLIRDKSPRGNNRTQPTAASRPVLQQDASGYWYLAYDGVDDFMVTGSVDFTATNKATAWAGVNKQSDAAAGLILELSTSVSLASNAGSFGLASSGTDGTDRQSWVAEARGSGGGADGTQPSVQGRPFVAPLSSVLSASYDLTQPTATLEVALRVNGVARNDRIAGAPAPGGNFGNFSLYFGRRGGTTLPLSGREYQTIIRGAASSLDQISQGERYTGSKMGIAL